MNIEKRALYNLLYMNWINDPSLPAKKWQVEDYRGLTTQDIFSRLGAWELPIDQETFFTYSEDVESPEELTERLLEGLQLTPMEQDSIYLLVFELWRRLLPERQCLTIFCDELDYQIFLYDKQDPSGAESIQDAIANLQKILDENVDQGAKPLEIFATISVACANDLESFLYDYIAEQIDSNNIAYATELYEGFSSYLKGSRWFDLINCRLLELTEPKHSQDLLKKLIQRVAKEGELSFNLELLSFLVQGGERSEFNKMVRKTLPLLQTEEDLLDLLTICADYYHWMDDEIREDKIQQLINNRDQGVLDQAIKAKEEDVAKLLKILR